MGYLEDSLVGDEAIVGRFRLHWSCWFWPWFLVLVGWVLIIPFFYGIARLVNLWSIECGVTDAKLVYKRGWIRRQAHDINLGSIDSLSVDQTFWGRIFGVGTLTIYGRGMDEITIDRLADPAGAKKLIEACMRDADD